MTRPHVSPMQANSWLRHTRREIELETLAANERFDRATSTAAGLRVFWLSCERRMRGVEFEVTGRPGGPWVFRNGWLQEARPNE